jgi:hypothetical protein
MLLNIGLLIPCTNAQSSNPPPCFEVKQVKLDTGQIKRQILSEFVSSCVRNHYWQNDKGIVLLREYQNEEGKLCWLLLPSIDDSYKDNPSNRFACFQGDIILIYDADSRGNAKFNLESKDALNQCLEQIIGDRVYRRPITTSRWADTVLPIINRKLNGKRRYTTGNGGSLIIIFNPDGSHQKILPV